MNKHSISILLPFYGRWDLTHACLTSLYQHMPLDTEIVLVNDASPDLDCKTGVAWWQKQGSNKLKIKYVENKENLGFGGSHNRGATFASGDILVFLSNDVVISGNFVPKIEEIIDKFDGEVLIGGRIVSFDSGWNTIMLNGNPSIVSYPEGWLVSCTRGMWDRIGGWDMDYGKFDAEDLDIGAWALYNDVPMRGLDLPFLQHMSGQTINPLYSNRRECTIKNIVIFKEKWTKKLEEKFSE